MNKFVDRFSRTTPSSSASRSLASQETGYALHSKGVETMLPEFDMPSVLDPSAFLQLHTDDSSDPSCRIKINHGTTTLAFRFKGGIIVAVDSRATAGSYIASGTVKKVIEINKFLLGTMAGGAADCQYWETYLGIQCRLHELRNRERISVAAASKYLSNLVYSYKGMGLSMGTMICGWDKTGPALFYVDSDGTRLKGDLFSVGSGSTFAYGVLDQGYSYDMEDADAQELGRRSIYAAAHRDAFSGNTVNLYHVKENGWEFIENVDINELHYAGLLALLDESEPELQSFALTKINTLIDTFWAEVADEVIKIESLSENLTFEARPLASLVASKVYYHLDNLDEALSFALGAGKLFDVAGTGNGGPTEREYVETVISKAIDVYIASKGVAPSSSADVAPVDARLEAIVERMFERCETDHEYKQALGIALSSHRLDVIQRIFEATKDVSLLEWVLQLLVREGVVAGSGRSYRDEVLHLLIKLFNSLPSPDYFSITQCFVYLNDASLASALISSLLSLSSDPTSATASVPVDREKVLTAYQIAFDLAETASQEFLEAVRTNLKGGDGIEAAEGAAAAGAVVVEKEGSELHRERVVSILTGEESIRLYLEFLYRNNHADLLILKGTKDALESRSSIFHSAVSFMNGFANAGTTSDLFIRENLEWLQRASNWSKFSATASLGVIHKGNLAQGRAILDPYFPKADGSTSSFYSEGGSLFALGLVNANHGSSETLGFLKDAMKTHAQSEVIQHGAALGLGVAGMGSGNEEIYDELRSVLFNDSAIAGEAAGYSMGLVMLGTGSEKALDEMLQYAHETQHEKIIRGLAIGISFLMYGKVEAADALIETLLGDTDAILRYGGIHTIAMAYAGTSDNKAIRKLLHVAVSDVNDDVRRAAVTALGFVLYRNPMQVVRIVELLAESYNPNVRYGAALALGISCAGTGLDDAVALLEPLTKDPVDFVRQGACISLAMILIQQNEAANPKVGSVRKIFEKIVGDKHEDAMAKFGAAVSQGIIDAGGRNVTISMQNKSGNNNMPAIVGMALFTQFWYWFPLAHLLSLAFTPTAIIGVNEDLQMPKFDFVSNTRPSLFAYPPATKPPTKEAVEKVATAVLSTTAKATARAKAKEAATTDVMDTDQPKTPVATTLEDTEMKVDEPTTAPVVVAKIRKTEPSVDHLSNLSRVTPAQLSYISFAPDARYVPVRPLFSTSAIPSPATSSSLLAASSSANLSAVIPRTTSITPSIGAGGGILMMRDREPEKKAEFLSMEVLKVVEVPVVQEAEAIVVDQGLLTDPIAPTPAPFEFTDWE